MTVGKLIEILQKAPKDMKVRCQFVTEEGDGFSEIECIGYGAGYFDSRSYRTKVLVIGEEMTEEDFPEEDLLWGRGLEESKRERLAELTRTVLPENEEGRKLPNANRDGRERRCGMIRPITLDCSFAVDLMCNLVNKRMHDLYLFSQTDISHKTMADEVRKVRSEIYDKLNALAGYIEEKEGGAE